MVDSVKNKTFLKEVIVHLLNRPQMYAQNVGSLEDQFHLLMTFYDFNLANELKYFIGKITKTSATLSSKYTTFEEMSEALKTFARKHKLYEDSSRS